jgi:uncharacterized protein Usg
MAYQSKDVGAGLGEACEFERRLKGARLLTAEVLYYMPDHPKLLQTFIGQLVDEAPAYPRLSRFLDYWRREIAAVIHSVRVAHGEMLTPAEWRNTGGEFRLN